MRKRLAVLLLPCALLALLLLPGPVAASSFTYTVERDVCTAGAGKYHLGQGVLRVRVLEFGNSGANRFTFRARVLHRGLHSTNWRFEYAWPIFETTFRDNSSSYWNSRSYSYDSPHNAYHRIVLTVGVWHDADLLSYRTFRGEAC